MSDFRKKIQHIKDWVSSEQEISDEKFVEEKDFIISFIKELIEYSDKLYEHYSITIDSNSRKRIKIGGSEDGSEEMETDISEDRLWWKKNTSSKK